MKIKICFGENNKLILLNVFFWIDFVGFFLNIFVNIFIYKFIERIVFIDSVVYVKEYINWNKIVYILIWIYV